MDDVAQRFARDVLTITGLSPNEENLKHEIEKKLETACGELSIRWTPYQLERTLLQSSTATHRFADVVHGAVIIEYEPPKVFNGRSGRPLRHAQDQARDYALLLAAEEGRAIEQYVLVAWDGEHVSSGAMTGGADSWEPIRRFDKDAARRLFGALATNGAPLISPKLLATYFGPQDETHGGRIVPMLFRSIKAATGRRNTKTALLFNEWRRLFGQASGVQSDRLKEFLIREGQRHSSEYAEHPDRYLYALNTYIAMVAKLVAAFSLPGAGEDLRDGSVPIADRMSQLENGDLFQTRGVSNLLIGDFFSWYLDDASWSELAPAVTALIDALAGIDFDRTKRSRESIRDLFKHMYEAFVPRDMRHSLGEFYTPDWLAAFVLDSMGWKPEQSLLDPTCGSGTFLLEAMKRRRASPAFAGADAGRLLAGLCGMDLNPLAVLTARASIVTFIGDAMDGSQPVRIPVYLADAINSAAEINGIFEHALQTEQGVFTFRLPATLVRGQDFYAMMAAASVAVNEGLDSAKILRRLSKWKAVAELSADDERLVVQTLEAFVELHKKNWDGIWCLIIAERFTAGAIGKSDMIAGNPPWVKWSHLPTDYAAFIKPHCEQLGVFSEDAWVGGIESDISTVVTYEAIRKWLRPHGRIGFLITGSVFKNESSQGFRRFELPAYNLRCNVLHADDFRSVKPFEGATNHPVLFVAERDVTLQYPVPYVTWYPPTAGGGKTYADADDFRKRAVKDALLARPVPGSDSGPWLVGTADEHRVWAHVFNQKTQHYKARKGVTTDLNGAFFVEVSDIDARSQTVTIQNDPALGRKPLPRVTKRVEDEHIFPLLRGRHVAAFCAEPDGAILVPQRSMHGDPDLPNSHRLTYAYLKRFEETLENRSSYRRFQKGQPWWSLWSTGPYTFDPFKVVWQEMPGGQFAAAYVGSARIGSLPARVVVPDHKVYFVPLATEAEAAFLTGFLNAPVVSHAVTSYAAQLSLGVSVVEYLDIPKFDPMAPNHTKLSTLSRTITRTGAGPTAADLSALDHLAYAILRLPMAAPLAKTGVAVAPQKNRRRR